MLNRSEVARGSRQGGEVKWVKHRLFYKVEKLSYVTVIETILQEYVTVMMNIRH